MFFNNPMPNCVPEYFRSSRKPRNANKEREDADLVQAHDEIAADTARFREIGTTFCDPLARTDRSRESPCGRHGNRYPAPVGAPVLAGRTKARIFPPSPSWPCSRPKGYGDGNWEGGMRYARAQKSLHLLDLQMMRGLFFRSHDHPARKGHDHRSREITF